MYHTDETHGPAWQRWVASANDGVGDVPVQNLPFGRFWRVGCEEEPLQIGMAIGVQILDLHAAMQVPARSDAVALSAYCKGPQMQRIGFGACVGTMCGEGASCR